MHRRWPHPASIAIVLLLALATLLLGGCQRGVSSGPTPTASAPRASASATNVAGQRPTATAARQSVSRPTPTPESTLPAVDANRLPKEAQETLRLIDAGGPFPYDRDGITFGNRERLLPLKPQGYYREYTVITPGSADRGARRIVAGQGGEFYYTDDHYESFRRVVR